jgi:hypothetical protein
MIARCNRSAGRESSYPDVRRELLRPLNQEERKKGYIYAYEVEGNRGFVKIGYTSHSVEKRHKQWAFDCNRDTRPLFPTPPDSGVAVPNARRVEALCHAELQYRNIRIDCSGCLKQHVEWFEVAPEDAVAVIRRWSKWMITCPYQPSSTRSSDAWTIKENESHRAKDIGRFIEELSNSSLNQQSESSC